VCSFANAGRLIESRGDRDARTDRTMRYKYNECSKPPIAPQIEGLIKERSFPADSTLFSLALSHRRSRDPINAHRARAAAKFQSPSLASVAHNNRFRLFTDNAPNFPVGPRADWLAGWVSSARCICSRLFSAGKLGNLFPGRFARLNF